MRTDNSIPKNEKETLDYIDNSATQLDEHRLAGLQEAKNTQLIKDEILQREKKRLENKHGNSHPEVQEAESRIKYNKQMFTGLNNEIEKASVKTEPFNRTSWRVHGRVFNNESKPVKGLTVFLADQNKRWIEFLGSSCTNDLGYYTLTVDEKTIDKIDKGQSLFLAVSDKNRKIIFISAEALIPVKGVIIYRDIYLNSEDCVPPPYNKTEIITG